DVCSSDLSGRAAIRSAISCLRRRSSSGSRPSTSTSPMTARRSMWNSEARPSASMRGPPTPMNSTFGLRALRARIRPEPRMSPDASPATSAIRKGAVMASAGDAARGRADRVAEQGHFGELTGRFLKLGHGLLDGQPLAIDDLVGAAQGLDCLGGEATPTHALEIHAARLGRVAEYGDESRHILT